MKLSLEQTSLSEVVLVKNDFFEDDRGFFLEVFRKDEFANAGLPIDIVQSNHSASAKNIVRGLHMQWEPPMGKLMRVTRGAAFLVAVDVRRSSPQFGEWYGIELSEADKVQVWAPAGFARGFCALREDTHIQYLCTGVYNNAGEGGIRWNDPKIGIEWPVSEPILSEKDKTAPLLDEWAETEGAQAVDSLK